MSKRFMLLLAVLVLCVTPVITTAQDDPLVIGFLPGVVDPFYQVMELGVRQAIEDYEALGIDVVVQYPETWGPSAQTPILDAMVARGDLDYLITAAVDKDQMIAPLQSAHEAGIEIISVDTFIGDGDYVNGPVTFPITYIGSDNVEGGRIAGHALAESIGEEGGVYIQNVVPGVSTTDQRAQGFQEAIAEYPGITFIGMDYNDDDANTAVQQTLAVIEREPNLAGIFGANVFSARGAGTAVQNAGMSDVIDVVAFDATVDNVEGMRNGVFSLVIAQKPYDMGYLAVQTAVADYRGVSSIPPRIPTGYAVLTPENVDDPEFARFIYQLP